MRKFLSLALLTFLGGKGFAQFPGLNLPPSGDNQKASITQFIGPVKVTIDYSSPKVHGPDGKDRRGKIWGQLVPYGMANLGFGNGKPSPWRAGANENTVFTVSHPVRIEDKLLPAGRYGFHIIPQKDEWTLVFSKNSTSWGSFFYEPTEDALRVTVKPRQHDYREWLTYEFTERKPDRATVELQWEDLAAGWTIAVDKIEELYISQLKQDLRTTGGFNYQGFLNAAQYTLTIGSHFDEGLEWAEAAISRPFVGVANFATLSMKAQLLNKLDRTEEAKQVMKTALAHPTASPIQIHQYARQLSAAGKTAEAGEIYEFNHKKHGDVWPVHVGLTRMYSARGDIAKALEHAKTALPQAPDQLNKTSLENMIKQLSAGQKVN
ncbi:MAG: DUF2911 domain-containing protein [Bryobacterales bacterium]|nr:DUF2911 domain-containing protein [Bryobacterales bacterium]